MRDPQPLRSWSAVAIPIKPRVIGQDLDAGAHDEVHEEHVQEVLRAQPPRKADDGGLPLGDAGVAPDEGFYRRNITQCLGDGDYDDQRQSCDRYGPQDVDPTVAD